MTKNTSKKSKGCLTVLLAIIAFSFMLFVYSFAWVPAIIAAIYFFAKKDLPNRKRNLIISAAIVVTSLITFGWINSTPDLTGISVEWSSSEYDIGDTFELKISPVREGAKIESLEISQNKIVSLEYQDGNALISFKDCGNASVFFVANGNIQSKATDITVIDKAEEEAHMKAEEEARLKAEEEAKQQAEEARLKSEEEAKLQAAENTQRNDDPIVYTTNTGDKYHRSGCRHLKKVK